MTMRPTKNIFISRHLQQFRKKRAGANVPIAILENVAASRPTENIAKLQLKL